MILFDAESKTLKQWYIEDYCTDKNGIPIKLLENTYDKAEKKNKSMRIFCLDCTKYNKCRGNRWDDCKIRKEVVRMIKE